MYLYMYMYLRLLFVVPVSSAYGLVHCQNVYTMYICFLIMHVHVCIYMYKNIQAT